MCCLKKSEPTGIVPKLCWSNSHVHESQNGLQKPCDIDVAKKHQTCMSWEFEKVSFTFSILQSIWQFFDYQFEQLWACGRCPDGFMPRPVNVRECIHEKRTFSISIYSRNHLEIEWYVSRKAQHASLWATFKKTLRWNFNKFQIFWIIYTNFSRRLRIL